MLLGHPSHLKAKAGGDKSMMEKRGPDERVKSAALQGPRDMAKATLPEPQTPEVALTPIATTRQGDVIGIRRSTSRRRNPPPDERRPTRSFKGTNEGPKLRYDVREEQDTGSPTGREAYGDGASVVVNEVGKARYTAKGGRCSDDRRS